VVGDKSLPVVSDYCHVALHMVLCELDYCYYGLQCAFELYCVCCSQICGLQAASRKQGL